MDLLFRIVLDFLVQGRGPHMRIGYDTEGSSLIIQDDSLPLAKKKFRMWAMLLGRPVAPEQLEALDQAVVQRDIVSMRRLLRAGFHRTCSRVRIVSQESNAPRSTHVAWVSDVTNAAAASRSCISHGPHAPYDAGMSMLLVLQPAAQPWREHAHLFVSTFVVDPHLFDEQGRVLQTAVHGLNTPLRDDQMYSEGSESPVQTTPTFADGQRHTMPGNNEALHACSGCELLFSDGLIIFLDQCAHAVCLRCATACAQRHVTLSGATPSNLPCPAVDCPCHFSPREVRTLVSTHDHSVLELNEVRLALSDGVMCPSCSAVFDRVLNDVGANDPLLEKFVCGACGTDFCAQCSEHPFHAGRGCRMQYSEQAPACRFCRNQASSTPAGANDVHTCDNPVCIERGKRCCTMPKPCGHPCRGTLGERHCVKCLDPECDAKHPLHEADDFCAICYVESLSEAPCLELQCGHVFHEHCLIEKLEKKWPTARITFQFMDCPLCAAPIQHHMLTPTLLALVKFRESLEARFMERLKLEGLLDIAAITSPEGRYYDRPMDYARDNLTYFQCFRCNKPYFGGLRECIGADQEEPNREELVCGGCSAGSASCAKHGTQHLEFKCKYCCNLAVWFCWGTTHFCDMCHSPPRKSVRAECPGEELCPLNAKHLPNGTECAIGCSICRSEGK